MKTLLAYYSSSRNLHILKNDIIDHFEAPWQEFYVKTLLPYAKITNLVIKPMSGKSSPNVLQRFFFFHHGIWVYWVHMLPKRKCRTFYGQWSLKNKDFFIHLSPAATRVCQNLMGLNATITWQIDLKWKNLTDKCPHTSLCLRLSTEYLPLFFFCSFLVLPPSVLSRWLVQLRGARVWKRPTEGGWGLSSQSVSQVWDCVSSASQWMCVHLPYIFVCVCGTKKKALCMCRSPCVHFKC